MNAPDRCAHVHQAIAAALVDLETDLLFGVLGDANLFFSESFAREFGGRYVSASHEAGACLMALGYALIADKVGVATVTYGAGLVNTLTPLMEGVKGRIPMVLLCGETPSTEKYHRHRAPQRELITSTGAGFEQLRLPGTIAEDLATGFRRALVECRPIVVSIPIELQWHSATYKAVRPYVPVLKALAPTGDDLDNAVGIIAAAKRPVVLAGRGAILSSAKDAVLRFAQRIDAPLATTLKAKGLFDSEDFNLGVFGTLSSPAATDVILESDCVISFGASLNNDTTSKLNFVKGKRLIQIDRDADALSKYVSPDAALFGDVELVAENLLRWMDVAEIAGSGYRSVELRDRIMGEILDESLFDEDGRGTVDIRRTLAALDKALPPKRVVVNDGGRFVFESWRNVHAEDPAFLINTNNCGSIGLSLSHGIGAAFAVEERPVVVVCGDGGFMHGGLAEFNTAVRYERDVIVFVCNDGSYGAEHVQLEDRNIDPSISLFSWPEFASVATALGGTGVTVRTDSDIDEAVSAINDRKGPLLIDIKIDPARMPNHSR